MCSRSWRSSEIRSRVVARGCVVDLVLELVDLGVDVVDEVEVALGDVVDDAVGDHPGRVVGRARPRERRRVVRTARAVGGVLRTVRSVSCVITRPISW